MAGVTARLVTAAGTVTVTLEVAVTPGVWTLVAVMTSLPPVAGAVYRPAEETVPRWADQVTPEL